MFYESSNKHLLQEEEGKQYREIGRNVAVEQGATLVLRLPRHRPCAEKKTALLFEFSSCYEKRWFAKTGSGQTEMRGNDPQVFGETQRVRTMRASLVENHGVSRL
jgi:hypothetical protein